MTTKMLIGQITDRKIVRRYVMGIKHVDDHRIYAVCCAYSSPFGILERRKKDMVAPTIMVSLLNVIFLPTLTDSIFLSFVENHVQIAHVRHTLLHHFAMSSQLASWYERMMVLKKLSKYLRQ